MERRSKQSITVIMWIALATFLTAVIFNSSAIPEAWILLPLTMVPITFGVLVTLALWSPAVFPWIDAERLRAMQSPTDADDQAQNAKRKRGNDRMSELSDIHLLLNLMDQDERETLKLELKQRVLGSATIGEDGEIEYRGTSLSDLFDEDQASKRNQK